MELSRNTRSPYSSTPQDLPPAERIIKRPPLVPSVAVAGLTEPDLELLLAPHLQALSDLAESFGNNHRAYGSLNCAHAELCPRLWGEVN